jgi:uncharacterized membrane protein
LTHAEAAVEATGDRGHPSLARMAIAVLSLVGIVLSLYLTLFKLGYFGILQCSIGGCETVQASEWADFLGLPVAAWGIGAYATLLALALVGVQPRFARERWISLAIFGVSAVGVAFSAWLTYLEAFVIRAWCQWCVISAVLITLIFILSIPALRRDR